MCCEGSPCIWPWFGLLVWSSSSHTTKSYSGSKVSKPPHPHHHSAAAAVSSPVLTTRPPLSIVFHTDNLNDGGKCNKLFKHGIRLGKVDLLLKRDQQPGHGSCYSVMATAIAMSKRVQRGNLQHQRGPAGGKNDRSCGCASAPTELGLNLYKVRSCTSVAVFCKLLKLLQDTKEP